MVTNAALAEGLFALAESHPPGDERLALLRAAYAVWDHPRELAGVRRLPDSIPLEALPTVALLRGARFEDALAAAVARLAGPRRTARAAARAGFLSAARVGEILAASPLEPRHLRGAAHFHTRASDGAATLEAMARACRRRGAQWAVVADHTRGLECVNGLDAEGLAMQRRAVAQWNQRHGDDTWLVQGVEVEILADGSLDLPRQARAALAVIAAVHTELEDPRDQTARLVRAIQEPGVWALAHPRGRLFARRGGVRANWEAVFAAASAAGVLVEINGFPRRQDLDTPLVRLALAAGCDVLLASDAHHPRHLAFDEWAVAIAAEAGVPAERMVNFAPRHRLAEFLPAAALPA